MYKMRLILLALCVGLVVAVKLKSPTRFLNYRDPENARELYDAFKQKYKKLEANEEDERRFGIFKDNLMRATVYQSYEQGSATYGVTQFSDLTAEEFAAMYTNSNFENNDEPIREVGDDLHVEDAPLRMDWREGGAVNAVEQQGSCGSCWAFSAIGNIEGQWYRKTGELLVLSKQQLVDCDKVSQGCNGGWPSEAYENIKKMGGIQNQATYPYKGSDGKCSMNPNKFVAYVNGTINLPLDEGKQTAWLADNGPMSVALNANLLQFYTGGVTHPWRMFCSPAGLNHAVLTVGYGMEGKKPYWLVKNSWGAGWGEKGYFRIYRGDGTCGIDRAATSAIIV